MDKESCSEINSVSCLNTPPGAGRQECHSHYSPVVPVAGTTAATQLTFRLKRAACAYQTILHLRGVAADFTSSPATGFAAGLVT